MATDSVHLAGNTLNRYIHKWLKRLRINTASIQHSCGCDSMIRKMNDWGVEESLKHIDEIVDQLYTGLQLTYLSALAIPTTKPIIRRIVTKCLLNVHLLSH